MDAEGYSFNMKDINLPDFSSQALYQVKDSEYERHLRTLRQVQQKRVRLLWKSKVRHGLPKTETCTAENRTANYEISWWKQAYSPDPPLCLTPVQKGYNDVTRPILKPTPRHVCVVRPVQYPEKEIDHIVTQPQIRSSESSPPDTIRRLPPKKRPYVYSPTDSETAAKVIKRSTGSSETSKLNEILPAQVTDGYPCELNVAEDEEMTAEDKEVAEIMKHNVDDGNFKLARKSYENNIIQEMDLDDEEDLIFQAEKYQENGCCNSPREPRISCQTDGTFVSTDVPDDQMGSVFRPISPATTINLSHQESLNEMEISSLQSSQITCKIPKTENSEYQSTDVQNIRDETGSMDEDGNTEAVSADSLSIEALRDKVLNDSGSHKRVYDADKSKEEKFAELLEDFLAENEDLPPEIRNDILDMLTDVSETVQEEKARQIAEINGLPEYFLGSNDNELVVGFDRPADLDPVIDEAVVKPLYGYFARQADTDNARKTSDNKEFENPPDKDLVLVATTEMSYYREPDSRADTVQRPLENTSDNNETENPAADIDVLTVTAREIPGNRDSNSSADTYMVLDEGNKISTGREFPGFDFTETKPKFGSIKDVPLEIDNTGESIYNEIAAFFGYDGYGDFLTY